ncbi:hydrolase [Rhodoblastus sphagnicola]|uniref:Hydrolase n=1 Tax=Rhodoblastus sphagnicola TaxID=333368 RepID=A0A2S6N7P6_9HYPH|nr:amidohydrolase family protein [Rhodoblastus sphagnicola]MBB4196707.1 imidazolonepropionase-like amidohydrolase [Rhodoblastus sphagnicola]PPQ30617.1 hydrolase [Rhodoblastus sphagnicola]
MRAGGKYQHLVQNRGCPCCDPRLVTFTHRATTELSRRGFVIGAGAVAGALSLGETPTPARAQPAKPSAILFENVRIFDGKADRLSGPSYVLVVGNLIQTISAAPIAAPADATLIRIDGKGRTLTPGLIDAHTHIMFSTVPQSVILTSDVGFIHVAAVKAAHDMLLRGFTSVRDLGGPVFGLKRGIDSGLAVGPRIWPAGAFISQTGGHGDFRMPNDFPARPGDYTFSERAGGSAIADDPGTVRKRAREQLALGASQIKLMAGGGVASPYDPLDVTQFTLEEMRAGVEAAENWGTYATVHAYTPRAVRQAVAAGVRCIDHGQLLDEATVALLAEKEIWWSLQPFLDIGPSAFPEGSPNDRKQQEMYRGTDNAYRLAIKHKVKTAWGTDILFDPKAAAMQGENLTRLLRWYSAAEILKLATSTNAELLALSGLRSPYEGRLGIVQEGALADLLLIDGDPLADLKLFEQPEKSLLVVMKDGKIFKNIPL